MAEHWKIALKILIDAVFYAASSDFPLPLIKAILKAYPE